MSLGYIAGVGIAESYDKSNSRFMFILFKEFNILDSQGHKNA